MADRVAKYAGDEIDELPTIDHVTTLKTRVTSSGNGDPFAAPAEQVKSLPGTDAVFKRRVTNQINKFHRGLDGAESKQIQEKEFITGYNAFDVIEPLHNLEYLAKLYELSSTHYSCVNAKVANIVGLGYKLVENSKTKRNLERLSGNEKKTKVWRQKLDEERDRVLELLERLNEEDTFTEVLVKVWRDYEVMGNGYIEIGRKKDGTIGYFGHVPAQTVRIRKNRDGFVQMTGFKVQYFANYGAGVDPDTNKPRPIKNPIGSDKPNEIIHLMKYSPTSGYYGIPDILAAMPAVTGNEFAQRYNLDYFENKAVPRYAIILKGAKLGNKAETDLLSFFETGLKGQNHRSIYIPLPGDSDQNKVELKLEAIETGIQDASFVNYKRSNDSDIMKAHRVPVTKISVSDGASLAVAKDADKTFKEQVCEPEQRVLEKKVNRVTREITAEFDLVLNEMSLTDENTQSQIDERRRKTGVETANEQRARRGEPAIEGGDELFDMNATAKAAEQRNEMTTNRQRDSVRSAGATDSAGAARNPKGEGRSVS